MIEYINTERGGVYVEEYGQSIPLELIMLNDEGTTEKAIKNVERLITVEKVHLLFHSYGTFQSMAAYPVVQGYEVPMILDDHCPVQVSWRDIVEEKKVVPKSMFWTMDHSYRAMEALMNFMKEVGVSDIAILEIETLFGAVNREPLEYLCEQEGIDIVLHKTYPIDVKDFTGVLLDIQAKDPDGLVGLTYPRDGWLMTEQLIELDVNPRMFYNALGVQNPDFVKRFGEQGEGIIGMGGCMYAPFAPWKSPTGLGCKDVWDMYLEKFGETLESQDGAWVLMSLDAAVSAIEKAGTLDPIAISDALRNYDHETLGGICHWKDTEWSNTGYNVPQYMSAEAAAQGIFEVVAQSWSYAGIDTTTAKPLYPKPKWKR